MKQHRFIIRCLLGGIGLLSGLGSCTDAPFTDNVSGADGTMVRVGIAYGAPQMQVQTRSMMPDEDASLVNDLYVVAFDARTGARAGGRHFSRAELREVSVATEGQYDRQGTVLMDLPTGTFYLAGVANVEHTIFDYAAGKQLLDELEHVESYDAFKQIRVTLKNKGDVNRLMPNLAMCGTFCRTDIESGAGDGDPVEIHRETTTLAGSIRLQRLDSYVKFVIRNETEHDGIVCNSFQLLDWQVCNVPDGSALCEGEEDREEGFHDTPVNIHFATLDDVASPIADGIQPGKGSGVFDFYLMENRKRFNREHGVPSTYKERDEELTDADGKHPTGRRQWKYAHRHAAYVVFHVRMLLTMPAGHAGNPGAYSRVADAAYVVHLGATHPSGSGEQTVDLTDYDTRRNTKYTYTVRVRGVDEIVVEAERNALNHNVEGIVVDNIGGRTIDCDSHYAVFNITLSGKQIGHTQISLYSEVENPNTDRFLLSDVPAGVRETSDYKAIRIAPATDANTLTDFSATYDEVTWKQTANDDPDSPLQEHDEQHVVPLYDLARFYEAFGRGHEADETPRHFTVFINEHVYYNRSWKDYINRRDRYWIFFSDARVSRDEASQHLTALYTIQQKSLQTFYNGETTYGMALEHTNEFRHKKVLNSLLNQKPPRSADGFWNSWVYIQRQHQERWTQLAHPANALKGQPTFATAFPLVANFPVIPSRNYYNDKDCDEPEVVYAAELTLLARNRDLNRNGVVEASELRWFLPSVSQYSDFVLGRSALVSPLFKLADYVASLGTVYHNPCFHLLGSDARLLWSEEGYSVGDMQNRVSRDDAAWDMRCVRYLGIHNPGKLEASVLPLPYREEGRVISISGISSRCLRNAVSGSLVRHHIFDSEVNIPSRRFRYARKPIVISIRNATDGKGHSFTDFIALSEAIRTNSLLEDYSEQPGGEDRGKWRIPNISELRMMKELMNAEMNRYGGQYGNSWRYFTCTTWYPAFTSPFILATDGKDLSMGTGESFFMGAVAENMSMLHPGFLYQGGKKANDIRAILIWPVRDVP